MQPNMYCRRLLISDQVNTALVQLCHGTFKQTTFKATHVLSVGLLSTSLNNVAYFANLFRLKLTLQNNIKNMFCF